MGRIRSALRRVARPAAMLAVAGTLAVSLVVTTPSNAQAFVDAKAAETFVKGATKTIAPAANVAMAAASFTPVGFGVRLLQLGFLAYSTSDIWMPIVAGAFGNADPNVDNSGVMYAEPGMRVTAGGQITGNDILAKYHYEATQPGGSFTGGWTAIYSAIGKCKRTSDGYIAYGLYEITQGTTSNQRATSFDREFIMKPCPNGWTTLGHIVGGGGGAQQSGTFSPRVSNVGTVTQVSVTFSGNSSSGSGTHGTENSMRYGELAPEGFDPYGENVKYKVRSECIDSAGVKTTIEAESSGEMVKFPSCEAAGKGHGTGKTSITGLAPGTTIEKPLWDSPAAPSDPSTPLCDASRPTGGCVLSVELDGKQCEAGIAECENWAELEKNEPGNPRLKCRFGPYTLPMASCAALEKAYFPGGAPATEENTDGDPATQNWNDPRGRPIPAQPPTTQVQTVPGGQGQPRPDEEEQTKNCFPSGWAALNPVEWVLKPTRCAFEPKKDLKARVEVAKHTMTGVAPFSWIDRQMTGPPPAGCPNWEMKVLGANWNVVCDSSFTDALRASRGAIAGMLIGAMVWPLFRSIWYSLIPILRVTPDGGSK